MSKLRFFEESGKLLFKDNDYAAGNLWENYGDWTNVGSVGDDDRRYVLASFGPKARGEWNQWADVEGDVLVIVTNKEGSG